MMEVLDNGHEAGTTDERASEPEVGGEGSEVIRRTRRGCADQGSSSHHSQSGGGWGHDGSGIQPPGGVHAGGAGGHPGGGRHRRLGRIRAATTSSPTAPPVAMTPVRTIDIAYIPAESVSDGELATARSTSLRKVRPIAMAIAANAPAPRSANTRRRWWRRTASSSRVSAEVCCCA